MRMIWARHKMEAATQFSAESDRSMSTSSRSCENLLSVTPVLVVEKKVNGAASTVFNNLW